MASQQSHPVPEPVFAGSGLARATIALLGLGIVIDLASIASSVMQYGLLARMLAGETVDPAIANANDDREQMLGIAQLGVLVVTAIGFLCWEHRAYRNLKQLGWEHAAFTPGAAVGAWFIPFINLVRPFQAMAELWRLSHPDPAGADEQASPPVMKLWWGAWILNNVAGQVAFRFPSESLDNLMQMTIVQAVASGVGVVAGVLALLVVRSISARQSERHRRLLLQPAIVADGV